MFVDKRKKPAKAHRFYAYLTSAEIERLQELDSFLDMHRRLMAPLLHERSNIQQRANQRMWVREKADAAA